ncbi:hypothetical protein POM88_039096 [Heracleum sosnowskyi]|uniref:ATPase AAA-type core domain-containing protein n=1 Tax=Heracleum sosnowskyi TaxID=360622 RepID=A0AAD8HCG5_9APIA|nr:hypothetical protein POM88_039096 [Heracleum sosnowskyi]
MNEVTTIQNAKRDLKLHTYAGRSWSSIDLEHASTFETLAMEPSEKKALMDDLDLFVKRRLRNVSSDNGLRTLLMGIANRSILVIEDIDCSVDLPDRTTQDKYARSNSCKFSLSGLLNCIDGLWSSCGDERIIIFTTNNKDKLDPALLRPGRMDMHIHMSYLTINGFKTLASTYLEITHHYWRFREIEELLGSIEVTPAEVAEELLRACDTDVCLGGLVGFLEEKKRKRTTVESKDGEEANPESKDGDTTSGVEIIPKAKKIKISDSEDGLYAAGCHPMQNGIVVPVNYTRTQDHLDLNVKPHEESDPMDDENIADDYDEGSKPIDDEDIEDDYSAENTSDETDDEDNETDDEDNETDNEDS